MHPTDIVNPTTQGAITSQIFRTLTHFATKKLRRPLRFYTAYEHVVSNLVKDKHIEKGVVNPLYSPYHSTSFPDLGVAPEIADLIRLRFWNLVLQGIIAPGPTQESSDTTKRTPSVLDLDFIVFTPYGMSVLTDSNNRIQVHDPDGYLANFFDAKPDPDPEMMRYLSEAVNTFRGGYLLATVVLLGTASDRLIDVVAESIDNAKGGNWFKHTYQQKSWVNITNRFEAVTHKLRSDFTSELDKSLTEGLKQTVPPIFHLIRMARNDIAHPSGRNFTWNEVSGFLHMFVGYYKILNDIIGVLELASSTAPNRSHK